MVAPTVPIDYTDAKYTDFTIVCKGGEKLRFSSYLLSAESRFAAAIDFGGRESKEGVMVSEFSKETMNYILNHLDPIRGVHILPANITELAKAAHQYCLDKLLYACREQMLADPLCEYLELTEEIFPEDKEQMLTMLMDRKLLKNITRELYIELYKYYSPVKLTEQFVGDGHTYADDIMIDDSNLDPGEYMDIAEMFGDGTASFRLLKMATTKWADERSRSKMTPLKGLPANVLEFFKVMVRYFPDYRKRFITPEIENQVRGILGGSYSTTTQIPDHKIVSAAWSRIKDTCEDLYQRVQQDYGVCKMMFSIIEARKN